MPSFERQTMDSMVERVKENPEAAAEAIWQKALSGTPSQNLATAAHSFHDAVEKFNVGIENIRRDLESAEKRLEDRMDDIAGIAESNKAQIGSVIHKIQTIEDERAKSQDKYIEKLESENEELQQPKKWWTEKWWGVLAIGMLGSVGTVLVGLALYRLLGLS